MHNPFKKPPEAEAAAQNQEAATSNPLDVVAGSQSGESSDALQGASSAESSANFAATGARTEPQMFVTQAVRDALAEQGVEVGEGEFTQEEANNHLEKAVFNDVSNAARDDTGPEQQLAAAIKGFTRAAQARYEGNLDQSTTQAEILRCLSEAVHYLNNHVAQHAPKEESNG